MPSPRTLALSPVTRRLLQAVLYEGIAVAVVAPTLALVFRHEAGSALLLTVSMSAIALAWNYLFNAAFERWEARRGQVGRSWPVRALHALGFEGGLLVMLVPYMAWWLHVGLLEAFVADLGIFVFFLGYTAGFTWAFDRVFGLPAALRTPH
ncbi:MAG: hypothetical protein RLZZ584_510 [Pseudomonadota bacterium]|jgi:uncharacterized membrane protein